MIKETPILTGNDAYRFLQILSNGPKFVSKEELKKREENFKKLESIRKFK